MTENREPAAAVGWAGAALHPATAGGGHEDRPVVQKAAEVLAERIRRQIVRGELRQGETLPPESELLERWGIGRPALREALRILESEHLIRVMRGNVGGAVVRVPSVAVAARSAAVILQMEGTPLPDIYRARLAMEPGAAYEAARQADGGAIARLEELLAREQSLVDDPRGWASAAVRFHEGVVAASGIRTLCLFADMLSEIIDEHQAIAVSVQTGTEGSANRSRATRSHARLLALVRAGSADGARQHWYRHIEEINSRYFAS
ncbi:FCD domain-containing protein [Acidiferrimicrobium sp. IK]|uniref:FadR/GntR family transcriptional regulator n=1 Tax=Acidiferrimicrobium sp. IK TaxID=2871700 RepID=UPI0021CB164D|nr:FCD domain-containing protein [Acidiferrimicrobium sp. IK]MCU4183439.1 FCD domain-containing protein [Acidiferrimicrobium sp. IK]